MFLIKIFFIRTQRLSNKVGLAHDDTSILCFYSNRENKYSTCPICHSSSLSLCVCVWESWELDKCPDQWVHYSSKKLACTTVTSCSKDVKMCTFSTKPDGLLCTFPRDGFIPQRFSIYNMYLKPQANQWWGTRSNNNEHLPWGWLALVFIYFSVLDCPF